MRQFIKENWIWIVLPMVLAVAVLIFLIKTMDEGEATPFIYNVGLPSTVSAPLLA